MIRYSITALAAGLTISVANLVSAQAVTFAVDTQLSTTTDMNLTGTALTASGNVLVGFKTPSLSPLGKLPATWGLAATETGATAFGPIALATFDGSYRLTYTGPTITAGSVTVNPGDNLLRADFLGSVFTGYGSAASIVDSVLGGGLVSYSSSLLGFDPSGDAGFSLNLTSVSPGSGVVAGTLKPFSAVSQGGFSAAILPRGGSAVGAVGGSAAPVNAMTVGVDNPVGTGTNIHLTGLTLASSSPVEFAFSDNSPALSALGNLPAILNLSATETGAIAFGPLALATFDGSSSITYAGPTITVDGVTVNPGDNLLSADFLGAVFTGYGSAGSLVDSNLGGGLVTYSSDFLTPDPLSDAGLSFGFTSADTLFAVVGGQLTDFSAVSQGAFATDFSTTGGVPEPATLTLLALGLSGLGFSRRKQ